MCMPDNPSFGLPDEAPLRALFVTCTAPVPESNLVYRCGLTARPIVSCHVQ